jgi:hypothetical protein
MVEEARKLAKTSTCQSKTLLEKQLLKWARAESLTFLDELSTSKLRELLALACRWDQQVRFAPSPGIGYSGLSMTPARRWLASATLATKRAESA